MYIAHVYIACILLIRTVIMYTNKYGCDAISIEIMPITIVCSVYRKHDISYIHNVCTHAYHGLKQYKISL